MRGGEKLPEYLTAEELTDEAIANADNKILINLFKGSKATIDSVISNSPF
jgi:hypothetical protein